MAIIICIYGQHDRFWYQCDSHKTNSSGGFKEMGHVSSFLVEALFAYGVDPFT